MSNELSIKDKMQIAIGNMRNYYKTPIGQMSDGSKKPLHMKVIDTDKAAIACAEICEQETKELREQLSKINIEGLTNNPVNTLLATALRSCSDEQLTSLAEELYQRTDNQYLQEMIGLKKLIHDLQNGLK